MTAVEAVGIDVGGTKAFGLALDREGNRLAELRLPTPNDAEGLVDALARMADRLGGDSPLGLGVPGLVDRDGVLISAPNVTNVRQLPLRRLLSERLGREVHVDNDNTLAALAEWRLGAGRGVDEMLLVGLGTGIGGGIVSGGALRRGHHGFAAEFGHMVVDPAGPACPCGRHGCWERFASGSGLAFLAREAATLGELEAVVAAVGKIDDIRGEHVRSAATLGDPQALAVIDTFAGWVSVGLMNLTNIFDPELIVISGGLSEDPELFLPPIEEHFERFEFAGESRTLPRLAFAELGTSAGAIGAALLAGMSSVPTARTALQPAETPDEAVVRRLSDAYEIALLADDIAAMDAAFWADERALRFGIAEVQYGYEAIAAWRAVAGGVSPGRTVVDRVVRQLAPGVVAVDLTFVNGDDPTVGRQSQTWVLGEDGWRIARAHVSLQQ